MVVFSQESMLPPWATAACERCVCVWPLNQNGLWSFLPDCQCEWSHHSCVSVASLTHPFVSGYKLCLVFLVVTTFDEIVLCIESFFVKQPRCLGSLHPRQSKHFLLCHCSTVVTCLQCLLALSLTQDIAKQLMENSLHHCVVITQILDAKVGIWLQTVQVCLFSNLETWWCLGKQLFVLLMKRHICSKIVLPTQTEVAVKSKQLGLMCSPLSAHWSNSNLQLSAQCPFLGQNEGKLPQCMLMCTTSHKCWQ